MDVLKILMSGISHRASAVDPNPNGPPLLGLSGTLSLLLGIAVLALVLPNPAATLLSAAWLIAIFAFCSGIVLVAQALRLRRMAD